VANVKRLRKYLQGSYDDGKTWETLSGPHPLRDEQMKEEDQDKLWMDVAVECSNIEKVGASKVIKRLMERFEVTRKQ
jgi:hypothetical protein